MSAGPNPCLSTSAIAELASGRAAADSQRSCGYLLTSLSSPPISRGIMPLLPTAADNSSEDSAPGVVRMCCCYRICQTSSSLLPRVWMILRSSNRSRQSGSQVLSLGTCWIPASSNSMISSLQKISNSSFTIEQQTSLPFPLDLISRWLLLRRSRALAKSPYRHQADHYQHAERQH